MSTTETKACGMCHCSDCDQCFPPMTVDEFLRRLDVRKQEESNVRHNPVLTVTVIRSLQARLDEAERLLTELTTEGFTTRPEFWPAVREARAFLRRANA